MQQQQQQVTAPPMGMNNHHNSGFTMGRPPFPPHISPTMLSSNHHLSLQQRKTLLLQVTYLSRYLILTFLSFGIIN
jgi:hypothetical protein